MRILAIERSEIWPETEAGVPGEAKVCGGEEGVFGNVGLGGVEDYVRKGEVPFVRGGVVERVEGGGCDCEVGVEDWAGEEEGADDCGVLCWRVDERVRGSVDDLVVGFVVSVG